MPRPVLSVRPVIGTGARAFHVAYHITWAQEVAEVSQDEGASLRVLPSIGALREALNAARTRRSLT
jgi:hypothetical protein